MNGLRFTVLSCSLREASRSRQLAYAAQELLSSQGHQAELIDLRDLSLPPFDDATAFEHAAYAPLHRAIAAVDGIFLAAPVYNWGLGGGVRTAIELTGAMSEPGLGAAWFDKVVTFLCAGGLPHSYMAFGPTALALMLDFKCVVNPYITHAVDRDWAGAIMTPELAARLAKTVAVGVELATALRHRSYRSDWEI